MSSFGSPNPFFIAGKKAYEIERSLRFNDGDSAYLNRTPSSASNKTTFTLSLWIKRASNLDEFQRIFEAGANTSNRTYFTFDGDDKLEINHRDGGSEAVNLTTTARFRDVSAWYHIVLAIDTTQSTSSDRIKIYVNGTQQTAFDTSTYPNSSKEFDINSTAVHYIGRTTNNTSKFDGYMAEINFVDGFQYDPSYFGQTDALTGQWNPKKYGGGYGTNGFYLNFSDNSGTTATTLGKDSSGNGNNFTPNNFNTHDSLIDTPTNNFCILNSAFNHHNRGELVLYEGNLKGDNGGGGDDLCHGTFGIKSGKWYFEATGSSVQSQSHFLGVQTSDAPQIQGGMYRNNGYIVNYSGTLTTGNGTYDSGDVMGVAIDADAGKVYFAKNNTYINSGNPSTGANASFTYTPSSTDHILPALMFDNISHTCIWYINFGQDSSFAGFKTAQGNTDSGGKGDFYYAPPSGFLALCSANLPDPTILLPNKHFDTLLWSGNATTSDRSITGLNFQPDWAWTKTRNFGYHHALFDAVRGPTNRLNSDQDYVENFTSGGNLASFDAPTSGNNDGGITWDYGTGNEWWNLSGKNYISWNWNAGDTDGKTYTVTVVSDSGNKYRFDGFGTSAVTLDLAEGGTYIFDQSDSSNSGHPLRFSTTSNGTHGGGSEYTTGVTTAGTPGQAGAYTQIVVAASAPALYYYCTNHSGMGGAINTNSTLGSSNFDGTIQVTSKVNATAGFSILTYPGTGSAGTIGHGLGVAPQGIITKRKSGGTEDWKVYHQNITGGYFLKLNATQVQTSNSDVYPNTAPTSTVYSLGNHASVNASGSTYVAYVFSEVAGYSKFGSYTGNGNSDGTFVFTGFRPALVIFKNTSATEAWSMFDNKRDPDNPVEKFLRPSGSNADTSGSNDIDFLSNGFKARTSNNPNSSGATYIYLAFSESPFKNARAR